ncbi:MAG: DUF58 domain-containing protein [Acidobacteria bacterium]|nr:DUF58 domain-containing protein [Acidobacteriota bacterium]MBV9476502.1 DUF58 domain-containing protein [Acidobacteriota bacterium]
MSFEFNGVVRLTRIGTTYILSTIVLAVAALNTGNNALYIAVSFMLGCLLLSGMASRGGLKSITVEVGGIGEAWAEHPADGTLRVRNRSRIWNVRDVVLVSDSLAAPVLIPLLPRRAERLVPASFLFHRRGLARVTAVDSYTRYPFGFFLKKRRLRVASEVVVFPKILANAALEERYRAVAGEDAGSQRPGAGSEIHAFREYTRGDSLRHVHWKKSASLGRWIMKQTELESARSVHVVVDPYKPREVSDAAFEEMISAAATFLLDASRRGADVTLSLPRVDLRARSGESAAPLFRALALLEPRFEPLHATIDRDTVFFSAAGGTRVQQSA